MAARVKTKNHLDHDHRMLICNATGAPKGTDLLNEE